MDDVLDRLCTFHQYRNLHRYICGFLVRFIYLFHILFSVLGGGNRQWWVYWVITSSKRYNRSANIDIDPANLNMAIVIINTVIKTMTNAIIIVVSSKVNFLFGFDVEFIPDPADDFNDVVIMEPLVLEVLLLVMIALVFRLDLNLDFEFWFRCWSGPVGKITCNIIIAIIVQILLKFLFYILLFFSKIPIAYTVVKVAK